MNALTSLVRILFLRGSPERFLYVRRNFIIGLFAALVMSAIAQFQFHQDHLVFVILRAFAEITCFMLWMVVLTAKVARIRLGNLMLVLVWASVLMDTILLALSLPLNVLNVEPGVRDVVAVGLGLAFCYGVISVVAWALRLRGFLNLAAAHLGGYLIAVFALDQAFRSLYGVMAGTS